MKLDQTTTTTNPVLSSKNGGGALWRDRAAAAVRVGRPLRISFALFLITTTLLGVAGSIGLWPEQKQESVQERVALLNLFAISATQAVTRGDYAAIGPLVQNLHGSRLVRSLAVRKENRDIVYESADHSRNWASAPAHGSTSTYARLPVFDGEKRWGAIELCFEEPQTAHVLGIEISPQLRAMVLTSISSFLVYWLCVHCAMKMAQRSAAVPERVQCVFDAMTEAVVLLDESEQIVYGNTAFWMLVKRTSDDMIGQTPSSLLWTDGDWRSKVLVLPWQETLKDGLARTRQRLILTGDDGSTRVLNATTSAIIGLNGTKVGVLLTLDDVSMMEAQLTQNSALLAQLARTTEELHRKNVELQILAMTDMLTGCHSRRALFEQLNRAWSQASRHNEALGCIMVDVDTFKLVNDTHGHATGDGVLKEIGQRLREVVRAGDIVGRYGGEEFCVVAPTTDLKHTGLLAERLRRAIEESPCGGLSVTVSLGIAAKDANTTNPEQLLACADNGLYAAKRAGRNRVEAGTLPNRAQAA